MFTLRVFLRKLKNGFLLTEMNTQGKMQKNIYKIVRNGKGLMNDVNVLK